MNTVTKEGLVDGLNEALASEYQAIMMYNTYAASVDGLARTELKEFFEDEIQDEFRHAQFLADKVSALGGLPTTEAPPVKQPRDPRGMLEAVLSAEQEAIYRYIELRKRAEEEGDLALVNDLEGIISDETHHKEETEKLLRGDWND